MSGRFFVVQYNWDGEHRSMDMGEAYDLIFTGAAIAYLVGQGTALYFMTGKWRIAAFVPLIIFLLAVAVLVFGIFTGANLAGVYMVMAVPLCVIYILLLWIAYFGLRYLR